MNNLKKICLAALLSAATLLAGAATPKDTLVMAFRFDDIVSLDPAVAFEISGVELVSNTYEKLVAYDIGNVAKVYGAVADSWTVSEDGKTITFKIKPNLKFASGNPITAYDAEYSFHRVIKMAQSPVFILDQFGFTPENMAETIKALDDSTLQITLNDNYANSFVLYCFTASVAAIVDSKLVKEHEKDGDWGAGWLKNNYAGSGSFILEKWEPNKVIVLKKNPNNTHRPAKLERVVINHVAESSVQRIMLEKGDIDIARNLQTDQVAGVKNNKDISLTFSPIGRVFYLALNQKNEILKNPKVIEAFKYLVNYQAIDESIFGVAGIEHQNFIPKGMLGAIDEKPYSYDPEKAKALLKEAGYEKGFKVGLNVRDASDRVEMAKLMQKNFAVAGIEADIRVATGKQNLTVYRSRQHDLMLQNWGIDYQDPNTNASTFVYNPNNADDAKISTLAWRNAWEVPKALTDKADLAVKERDIAKRQALYEEIQREFVKTSPIIIFAQEQNVAASRAGINGFRLGSAADDNLYYSIGK